MHITIQKSHTGPFDFKTWKIPSSLMPVLCVTGPWYQDHGSRMRRAGVGSNPLHVFCATSALVSNLHFKKLSPGSQGDSREPGRQSADKVKVSQQSPHVQKHQEKASNTSSTSCNSPVLLYLPPLLSSPLREIYNIYYLHMRRDKETGRWKNEKKAVK